MVKLRMFFLKEFMFFFESSALKVYNKIV